MECHLSGLIISCTMPVVGLHQKLGYVAVLMYLVHLYKMMAYAIVVNNFEDLFADGSDPYLQFNLCRDSADRKARTAITEKSVWRPRGARVTSAEAKRQDEW